MKKILILLLYAGIIFAAPNNEEQKKEEDLIISSDTLMIKQGLGETSVDNFLMNDLEPSTILELRKKEENLVEQKNKPLNDNYTVKNLSKTYKEGELLTVYGLVNSPIIFEFFDNAKNNLTFKYVTGSSPYFTIEQDKNDKHRIFVTPTQKFRNGIILIGTNAFDFPIQIKIQENSKGDEFHNYVRIQTEKGISTPEKPIEQRFKEAVFEEQIVLDNFSRYPQIDYELWSIKEGKKVFLKDAMKIFYFDNEAYKGHYIVLLHKSFKILGYDKLMFKKYNNDYNVYYLDFNINVFSLISEANFQSINNEERLRVVVKN